MTNTINGISIQVGLSGYSFKIQADSQEMSSDWMTSDRIFTSPELQRRYDSVEISVFTPKCALVPSQFHSPEASRRLLAEVTALKDEDPVDFVEVADQAAVLVYSNAIGETLSKVISETVLCADGSKVKPLPELYFMLRDLRNVTEYNKIVASYMDGYLYLVIAQGKTLLLCNSFRAPDFTTAEYFIFLALKKLQLNPELSAICFRTPLDQEQELSLYRSFRSVERI